MKTRHTFGILLIIAVSAIAVFGRDDFTLENIVAKPGAKSSGFISVPKGVDEGTEIPVTVFHGARAGKVFVIMAGLHGSEYAPVLGVQRVAAQLDPQKMSGTVIVIHVANMPSFLKRTVYYGTDGKNLNRSFPGRADGSITERIAHTLIEKIIKRGDFLIDVHCGDNNESLRPYVVYYDAPAADRAKIAASRRMAEMFGIDFIKATYVAEFDYSKSTFGTRAALIAGLAVIAVESGQLGKPEPIAIDRIERGLLNVLRDLTFVEGRAFKPRKATVVVRDQTVRASKTGLFYSFVDRDEKVKKDQLLGYVTDFFGNRIEEARAPFDGVVMYFTATPPVTAGEPLVNIGELEKNRK